MAVKFIALTDTLETFRTTFNEMCLDDFGDIANLSGSIAATNLVDAMNETISIATSTAGWTVEDSTSTTQIIGGGDHLKVLGTSNEITAVVSAIDTLTIGMPDNVTIGNNLTVTQEVASVSSVIGTTLTLVSGSITDSNGYISFGDDNLTTSGHIQSSTLETTGTLTANALSTPNLSAATISGTGSTHTLGTIQISGNTISSTDSTAVKIADSLEATDFNVNGLRIWSASDYGYITSTRPDKEFVVEGKPNIIHNSIQMEGLVTNAFNTTLMVTEPTQANTITFPNSTGTVALTGTTSYATSSIFSTPVTLIIYNSAGVAQKTIVGSAT
jgi:hypothetical protein|tara:strand:- start:1210 stop:2196 length:987 start_codon:yes stop_codon:yes gene_type:complete